MAITTQGFRLSNLPRFTPVDPSLVAFNPSAATSGIMDALKVGATLERIKADRAAAEELAATREARIAYENAVKGAGARVAPRKADLELATIGLEEGVLGKRYKAEGVDLVNKIAAGERLFEQQPVIGDLEWMKLGKQISDIQTAPEKEGLAQRKILAEIAHLDSEAQKNLAAARSMGEKEAKLPPDQETYLKALGEMAAAMSTTPEELKRLIASNATDQNGTPYLTTFYRWMKRQGVGMMGGALEEMPGAPVVGGVAAQTGPAPAAPVGRPRVIIDKAGNVKKVSETSAAPSAVVQPAAVPVVVPAQEKPAGSIAKPEGEKTTSTARPQTAQEAAHGDLGALSPTPKPKSEESLVDLQSLATLGLPALTQLKAKAQSPDLLRAAARIKTAGRGIAAGARGLMTPAGLGALASRAAGTATLAPLIAEGYNKVGGALASNYFGTDKMTLLDAQAAGVAAPTTQEAVSREQFDRITRTISDIVARIEEIRGLEGVDEMTKAEAVAELTRQGQALAARRNSLLSSI